MRRSCEKYSRASKAVHARIEKRAEPLQIAQLTKVSNWLVSAIADPNTTPARIAAHKRDHALMLLGFWRGFRTDELMRLQVENIRLVAGRGMTCFLPRSKGDRQNRGNTFTVPALSRLCPVTAVREWIKTAELKGGPLFRSVGKSGLIGNGALHANSFVPLLRRLFSDAGLESPKVYSGHSLRRGFAGWANANGWDLRALMEYVGWKDARSAMRYVDGADPFRTLRIEASLAEPAALTVE